jgi:hypothetical protein
LAGSEASNIGISALSTHMESLFGVHSRPRATFVTACNRFVRPHTTIHCAVRTMHEPVRRNRGARVLFTAVAALIFDEVFC